MTKSSGVGRANIVILTGAGISQESGVATFRDKGGIWEKNRIEDVATPAAFRRDKARVQAFYNARRAALRPNVVWFGEMPFFMDEIELALSRCGVFIAIGTSGQVYPAAGFINAVAGRARCFELTMENSAVSPLFDERHFGLATQTVPALVERLLAG